MQRLQRWALLGLLAFGTAGKIDRLEDAERTHFLALRVFMTEKDQKAFLKLKTPALRDQWLKDHGLWARFYQYDARRREEISAGHVATGWLQDQVFMAWGPPYQRQKSLDASLSGRVEVLTYRFEVSEDGEILVWAEGSKETHHAQDRFRQRLTLQNGAVLRMERVEGWD